MGGRHPEGHQGHGLHVSEARPALSDPERAEKLHRIYELEAPENFFNSPWFEEICLFLELSPSRIRGAVFDRYEDNCGRRHPLI